MGSMSILMFFLGLMYFFIIRGPNVNRDLMVNVLSVLSFAGIIFAVSSRRWYFIVPGLFLNGLIALFCFFLIVW
ncbi:hypothetical protein CN918_30840 [Priestia megaterium]|nr:hypothetical protein CN918_30840 [Priestia megaterium]